MARRTKQIIPKEFWGKINLKHSHIVERDGNIKSIFDEYYDHLLKSNISNSTWIGYKILLNKFLDYLIKENVMVWEEITKEYLSSFIVKLSSDVSVDNAKRFLKQFKSMCKFVSKAYPDKHLSELEFFKYDFKGVRHHQLYSDSDIRLIFDFLNQKNNDFYYVRMKVILSLILQVGIRCIECIALKLDDVDFEGNCIYVRGKQSRTLLMSSTLKIILYDYIEVRRKYLKFKDTRCLFVDQNDERVSYNTLRMWAKRNIIKNIKLSDDKVFSFDNFRVKFAVEFYKKTRDIKKLQKVLGHSKMVSTLKYIEIAECEIRDSEIVSVNDFIFKFMD